MLKYIISKSNELKRNYTKIQLNKISKEAKNTERKSEKVRGGMHNVSGFSVVQSLMTSNPLCIRTPMLSVIPMIPQVLKERGWKLLEN